MAQTVSISNTESGFIHIEGVIRRDASHPFTTYDFLGAENCTTTVLPSLRCPAPGLITRPLLLMSAGLLGTTSKVVGRLAHFSIKFLRTCFLVGGFHEMEVSN